MNTKIAMLTLLLAVIVALTYNSAAVDAQETASPKPPPPPGPFKKFAGRV